jgi:hypothetical protein
MDIDTCIVSVPFFTGGFSSSPRAPGTPTMLPVRPCCEAIRQSDQSIHLTNRNHNLSLDFSSCIQQIRRPNNCWGRTYPEQFAHVILDVHDLNLYVQLACLICPNLQWIWGLPCEVSTQDNFALALVLVHPEEEKTDVCSRWSRESMMGSPNGWKGWAVLELAEIPSKDLINVKRVKKDSPHRGDQMYPWAGSLAW